MSYFVNELELIDGGIYAIEKKFGRSKYTGDIIRWHKNTRPHIEVLNSDKKYNFMYGVGPYLPDDETETEYVICNIINIRHIMEVLEHSGFKKEVLKYYSEYGEKYEEKIKYTHESGLTLYYINIGFYYFDDKTNLWVASFDGLANFQQMCESMGYNINWKIQ